MVTGLAFQLVDYDDGRHGARCFYARPVRLSRRLDHPGRVPIRHQGNTLQVSLPDVQLLSASTRVTFARASAPTLMRPRQALSSLASGLDIQQLRGGQGARRLLPPLRGAPECLGHGSGTSSWIEGCLGAGKRRPSEVEALPRTVVLCEAHPLCLMCVG